MFIQLLLQVFCLFSCTAKDENQGLKPARQRPITILHPKSCMFLSNFTAGNHPRSPVWRLLKDALVLVCALLETPIAIERRGQGGFCPCYWRGHQILGTQTTMFTPSSTCHKWKPELVPLPGTFRWEWSSGCSSSIFFSFNSKVRLVSNKLTIFRV